MNTSAKTLAVFAMIVLGIGNWLCSDTACAQKVSAAAVEDKDAASATDQRAVRTTQSNSASARQANADLPPVGRSLFDHYTMQRQGGERVQRVPLPFDALLHDLQRRVAPDALGQSGVKAVLIPMGRSLQKNAAVGEYFKYPRVVAAIVGEIQDSATAPAMLLTDRLYLGYHEKAAVLEVISYNEAAGRFEYQVVKDYRPGGTPRVFYARRTVCLACHQNAAPIFSRPTWDETNANPLLARQLLAQRANFYGVPVRRGVDEPNAIDNAVNRANLFSIAQTLWRDGCTSARCRAHAYELALKYRLSGEERVDSTAQKYRDSLSAPLRSAWAKRWPQGLAVADPDIPNRAPFVGTPEALAETPDQTTLLRAAEIRPSFDPLVTRAPLEWWRANDAGDIDRFVKVLAGFIANADLAELEEALVHDPVAATAARRMLRLNCDLNTASDRTHLDLRCAAAAGEPAMRIDGRLTMRGDRIGGGTLTRIAFEDGQSMRGVSVLPAPIRVRNTVQRADLRPMRNGLRARLSDGRAIERASLSWERKAARGDLEVVLADDFTAVANAIEDVAADSEAGRSDAFSARPIRREAVMRALLGKLGRQLPAWCCSEDSGMPAAATDSDPLAQTADISDALQPFYRYCAACHDTPDPSPPGFLHGDAQTVAANLDRCAERILFRLDMWQLPEDERAKTPMPPRRASPPPADALARMRAHAARAIKARTGREADAAAYRAKPYETLAACRLDAH